MRKPTKDPIREDRIHNEAIVEAYGSEEQAMSLVLLPGKQNPLPVLSKVHRREPRVSPQKRRDRRSPPPGAGGRLFHGYARAHSLAGPEHGGASIPTGSARSERIHRRSHR